MAVKKFNIFVVFFLTLSSFLHAHFLPCDCSQLTIDEHGPKTILEKIKEKKTLDVVILNSPTTYYAGAEKTQGFEYELISEFAKSIGVDLNLTIVYTISEALQKSRENVGDITVAGLTITKERKKEFKFGPQYHTVQEKLICSKDLYRTKRFPRDLVDLPKLKIIVGKDTSYVSTLNNVKNEVIDFDFNTTIEYSTEQLLDLTHKGEIDCTVADSSIFRINQRYYPKLVRALILSGRKSLGWIIRDGDDSLNDALYKWLNAYERSGKMAELRDYYFSFLSIFDYYDTSIFYERLKNRLPKYRKYFMDAGRKYNIPWMLLAAQSYQESHWNPNAKSHTGVRGMMMITKDTAKLLGVKNRVNAKESIYAGARYLRIVERKLPPEIKGKNRWAFALAAYNVGLGHIYDAQSLAIKLTKNPYSWTDLKEVLPLLTQKKYYRNLKYGYARGNEPVKYVDAIQNYSDLIQKNEAKIRQEKLEKERLAKEKRELERKKKELAMIAEAKKLGITLAELKELRKNALSVVPIKRTWLGYIDINTKRKKDKFISESFELDPSKDWLLLFGGGSIKFVINGEKKSYTSKRNMRFKYVDGEFSKIGVEEFKRLNNGKKW